MAVWAFDQVEIRTRERRVSRAGVVQPLGARAFDLLPVLIDRRGQVVPKDEVCAKVLLTIFHSPAKRESEK